MTLVLRTAKGVERMLAKEVVKLTGLKSGVAIQADGEVWVEGGVCHLELLKSKSRFVDRISLKHEAASSLEEVKMIASELQGRSVELISRVPVLWTGREIVSAVKAGADFGGEGTIIAATEVGNKVRLERELYSRIPRKDKVTQRGWSLFSDEESSPAPLVERQPLTSVISGFIETTRVLQMTSQIIFDPFCGDAKLARALASGDVSFYGAGVSPHADLCDLEKSNLKLTQKPFEQMLDLITDPLLLTVVTKNLETSSSENVHEKLRRLGAVCKHRTDFKGLWILSDDTRVKAWSGLRFECMQEFGRWQVLRWLGRKM